MHKLIIKIKELKKQHNKNIFDKNQRGIEKESLRVDLDNYISKLSHPKNLGKALTNKYITTDYAEALLELVTPPYLSIEQTLEQLTLTHHFVYNNLHNEKLWPLSMPPNLANNYQAIIASYGSSNVAKLKELYRSGLHYRYGDNMQLISGIHYNFSLSEDFWQIYPNDKNTGYMALCRNFVRNLYVIYYLLGASPGYCDNFLDGMRLASHSRLRGNDELSGNDEISRNVNKNATTLRMTDIGYQSTEQEQINIHFDDLDEYFTKLRKAIITPDEKYKNIEHQISSNLLQIENEYYSPIRPKPKFESGKKSLINLRDSGIDYIEVRAIDLDPFEPIGISQDTCYFLEVFLIFCILEDSPKIDSFELNNIKAKNKLVAKDGLNQSNKNIKQDVINFLEKLTNIADLLDYLYENNNYSHAINLQIDKINNNNLPAQKMHNFDLQDLGAQLSDKYHNYFANLKTPDFSEFILEAKNSEIRQKELEELSKNFIFDEYLKSYFKGL